MQLSKYLKNQNGLLNIILCLTAFLLCFDENHVGKAITIIFCNFICVNNTKKNYFLLVIFLLITYFNYSILYANIFFPLANSLYVINNLHTSYFNISLNVLLFFNIGLFYILPKNIKPTRTCYDCENGYTNITLFFCFLLLIYILIFEFDRGELGIGERNSGSPIYEYSIIIALIVSTKIRKKNWKILFTIVFLLFAIQEMAYGGRVTALQYLLLIYLVFFSERYSIMSILPFAAIIMFIFTLVGTLRSEILQSNIEASYIWSSIIQGGFSLDTAYSAYFTSEMMTRLAENISINERLSLFYSFIESVFTGVGGVVRRNLPSYVFNTYWHSFGGLCCHYMYFYLGYFGMIFPLVFLKKYFSYINDHISISCNVKAMIGIYVTITTPRWYLYTPLGLFRGVIFVIIAYYALYVFDNLCKNRNLTSFSN